MSRGTWQRVAGFSEQHRWHLDNEWLGRLAETGLRRAHLVEATAPLNLETAASIRPWLAKLLVLGSPSIRLQRHTGPAPLVYRLVHRRPVRIKLQPIRRSSSKAALKSKH